MLSPYQKSMFKNFNMVSLWEARKTSFQSSVDAMALELSGNFSKSLPKSDTVESDGFTLSDNISNISWRESSLGDFYSVLGPAGGRDLRDSSGLLLKDGFLQMDILWYEVGVGCEIVVAGWC